MGTADDQRRRRVGLAGSVRGAPLWWDDGTDEEGRVGGDRWRGKTLLLYCVATPEHCPVPLQHSASSQFCFKSFHNNNINNNNDHNNAKKIYINPSHVSQP